MVGWRGKNMSVRYKVKSSNEGAKLCLSGHAKKWKRSVYHKQVLWEGLEKPVRSSVAGTVVKREIGNGGGGDYRRQRTTKKGKKI